MGLRFSFNLFGTRVSIPLFGGGKMRVYGNTARRATDKDGKANFNPRISLSEKGKGVSFPLSPNKKRGIGWWL